MNNNDILSVATNAINTVTSTANTQLVWTTVCVAIVTVLTAFFSIWLSHKFKQEKQKIAKDAVDEILKEISNNDNMREKLINIMLNNKEFIQKLDESVDIHTRDKVDFFYDKSKNKELK